MHNDNLHTQVVGTLRIYDRDTGTTLVNKRNAIHPGNMAYLIASAISGQSLGMNIEGSDPMINWMGFGNGGSSSTTTLSYRSPQVSEIYDGLPISSSASRLYARTYEQKIEKDGGSSDIRVYYPGEEIDDTVVPNRTSKIKFSVTMDHESYQAIQRQRNNLSISTPETDSSNDTVSVQAFTFDEIGLISGVGGEEFEEDKSLMLTHVTFHPVLLSANRTIVIDYTITIQIS